MRRKAEPDPGLALIEEYERRMVSAYDERVQGASADDIARDRPGVVTLAASIAERLRAEYRERQAR